MVVVVVVVEVVVVDGVVVDGVVDVVVVEGVVVVVTRLAVLAIARDTVLGEVSALKRNKTIENYIWLRP